MWRQKELMFEVSLGWRLKEADERLFLQIICYTLMRCNQTKQLLVTVKVGWFPETLTFNPQGGIQTHTLVCNIILLEVLFCGEKRKPMETSSTWWKSGTKLLYPEEPSSRIWTFDLGHPKCPSSVICLSCKCPLTPSGIRHNCKGRSRQYGKRGWPVGRTFRKPWNRSINRWHDLKIELNVTFLSTWYRPRKKESQLRNCLHHKSLWTHV